MLVDDIQITHDLAHMYAYIYIYIYTYMYILVCLALLLIHVPNMATIKHVR